MARSDPPDVPGAWPRLIIRYRAARRFEDQLYLTVMVTLVEDQKLNQEDGMVGVKVHFSM
jgi:hypothetical protein